MVEKFGQMNNDIPAGDLREIEEKRNKAILQRKGSIKWGHYSQEDMEEIDKEFMAIRGIINGIRDENDFVIEREIISIKNRLQRLERMGVSIINISGENLVYLLDEILTSVERRGKNTKDLIWKVQMGIEQVRPKSFIVDGSRDER